MKWTISFSKDLRRCFLLKQKAGLLCLVAEKINTKQMAEQHNRTKAADAPALKPEQMLERWLVKYARVHMNQGASYGKGGENHVRMNIATSRKTLEKALGNLANALKPAALSSAL